MADLILRGETRLNDVMKKSKQQGMKTFDQAVYELYRQGQISYEDAILHADSPNEVRLMIKLGQKVKPEDVSSALDGITLEGTQDSNERVLSLRTSRKSFFMESS